MYCKFCPHVGVYAGNGYTIESTLGGVCLCAGVRRHGGQKRSGNNRTEKEGHGGGKSGRFGESMKKGRRNPPLFLYLI